MSKLFIPYLNPIKYQELTPTQLPQYLSKSIEKYPHLQTIEEWEEDILYPQLFMTTDAIRQQIISGYGPVNMQVIDKTGKVFINDPFTQKLQNKRDTSQWIYENETLLNTLSHGYYFIKLTIGTTSPTVLISEPIFICNTIPHSVLLEYRHRSYYGEVLFETGITFQVRVLGKVLLKSPASKDTIYEDQPLNETLIWSYPYEVYTFSVGGSWGIPDYLIKRLNWIFGCSQLSIDGVQYVKNEGAKWEEKSFENYPLKGWQIEVREALGGRGGQVYQNSVLQNQKVAIIATIDMDAIASGGSDELPVNDLK